MNNIVIGQYVPGNSWLHKLDARIKLISLIFLIASIFVIPIFSKNIPQLITSKIPENFISLIILSIITLFIIICIFTSKIPILKILKAFKPVVFLLTITIIIQILSVDSNNVSKPLLKEPLKMTLSWSAIGVIILLTIIYMFLKGYFKFKTILFLVFVFLIFLVQYYMPWPNNKPLVYNVNFYEVSLIKTAFLILRILNVIMLTSLLTFTTMTTDLNKALEFLIYPLKYIKVPVSTISMMFSLTLRFIPTLLIEFNKIMKAQASRGVDFKENKLKDKIVQVISLLVPVFLLSIKRAEELANAMEARGYILEAKRSNIDLYKFRVSDFFYFAISVLILGLIITYRVLFG